MGRKTGRIETSGQQLSQNLRGVGTGGLAVGRQGATHPRESGVSFATLRPVGLASALLSRSCKRLLVIGRSSLPWQARLTLSAGAGLYEELLFRLVGITLVQFIATNLLGAAREVGATIAVFVSAVAFAAYHRTTLPGGGADLTLLTYYGLAGLYFGSLFIFRGFGIVAATHFLFDALVLVAIPAAGARN